MVEVNIADAQSRVDRAEQYSAVGSHILHHDPTGSLRQESLLTRKIHRVERWIAARLAGGKPDLISTWRPVQRANRAPASREHSLRLVRANHGQRVITHFRVVIEEGHKLAVTGNAWRKRRERIDLVQHSPHGIFEAMLSIDGSRDG